MARARSGALVKPKLNILLFGGTGTGKSTMAMQIAYFKREDGTPFRVLVLDAESGGCEECLIELEENGVDLRNLYLVYSQSTKEIEDYIAKVTNKEPFYELDEDGNETDTIVTDAYGEPFYPDAIILDGTSVLKLTNTQSLLELSRKRNKIKAEKAGLSAEERFVATANANLELRDYSQLNYSGQSIVLSLMACGAHVILTAREKDEVINVKNERGEVVSVNTSKKCYDSFKGMDYNVKTLIRMFRDENNQVCAEIEKDRSKTFEAGTIIEDPTLLAFEDVIEKGKNNKEFIIKNDLSKSIETDQKIFEKQILGSDTETETDSSTTDPKVIISEINDLLKGLSVPDKKAVRAKVKEANLPDNFSKVTDVEILNKILETVKSNL